jgi:NitT/TauT family transport system ATP-binding protein
MSTLRLVIHAPTAQALQRARSNARNLLAAEPDALIEIVVNAEGALEALKSCDPATDPLIMICENTLTNRGIPTPERSTVKSAVLHLAARQMEGWAYIRA